VPIIRFVFAWFCPISNAFANPKSTAVVGVVVVAAVAMTNGT